VPQTGALNGFLARLNARVQSATAGQRATGAAPIAHAVAHPPAQQRPVARPQPAAQGRPVASGGNGNARQAQPAQSAQKAPPPRMQGQGMGEFAGADDDIPF